MRRIFWGFRRNWFLMSHLHYLSGRSDFGFEFAEIFVFEKNSPLSPIRGVADSPYRWYGESTIYRFIDSYFWYAPGYRTGGARRRTCRYMDCITRESLATNFLEVVPPFKTDDPFFEPKRWNQFFAVLRARALYFDLKTSAIVCEVMTVRLVLTWNQKQSGTDREGKNWPYRTDIILKDERAVSKSMALYLCQLMGAAVRGDMGEYNCVHMCETITFFQCVHILKWTSEST